MREHFTIENDVLMYKIINDTLKQQNWPKNLIPQGTLDRDNVVWRNNLINQINIYNLKTEKNIGYLPGTEALHYNNRDCKNIMFTAMSFRKIVVYNIDKKSICHIKQLNFRCSYRSRIVGDILYLIDADNIEIYKYTLSGNIIGSIEIYEKQIEMCDHEIITLHNNLLSYYDFDGHKLKTVELIASVESFQVTTNYVYVIDKSNTLNIYERVI
jgi:hypothetical protein